MFRNALRQSTRAVGAISATSRVAVSPYLLPSARIRANSIPNRLEAHLNGISGPSQPSIACFGAGIGVVVELLELFPDSKHTAGG